LIQAPLKQRLSHREGDCDACPPAGGFRTQDEMLNLFANYWVD